MSNDVSIKVGAQADLSAVEKEVNNLGQSIAASGKMKFTPISVKDLDTLKEYQRRVQELVKVSAPLRQKLKATGQENVPFTQWDWERMHPHAPSRNGAMLQAFRHVFGNTFGAAPPAPEAPTPGGNRPGGQPRQPVPPAPRPARPGDGSWTGMAGQVAQAGLSATGPAGGVAANALGMGMGGGLAAGAMGLLGGMLALGVGKLVSSVAEKIDAAEQNNVDTDTLKRQLGDVGVSFGVLKTVVHSSAEQMKITYGEAGRLSAQFAKLANLTGADYKTIGQEVGTGVGLSRSFGLDPAQGVGVMGMMRGLGITRDAQESRRFALLIGETIGKSDAFAKAGEVMDAIANYAAMQTRNGMGPANVAGYAGMYSAMVGSGLPGMDTQGAASLLARINASLAGGGAKGEASQFFTTSLGASMGLSPYQIRSMREHGAFATANQAFGKDSVWSKYHGGKIGPGGSTTLLQGTMDRVRQQYGNGTDEAADALANHLGIGFNQAMALLTLKPNEMGEMQRYAGDMTKLSGKGIGNLSKALYGSAADRSALADDFLGRTGSDAISADDRKALTAARGNDDKLRDVLGRMAANYDQERTTGSDIRDSKNLLDNLKTAMADKLVPYTQDIRAGVLHLAGKGQKTGDEVLKEIAEMEAKDRAARVGKLAQSERDRINAEFEKRETAIAPGVSPGDIFKQDWHQEYAKKLKAGTVTPEEKAAFEKRVREYEAARLKGMNDPEVARQKRELDEERRRLLAEVGKKEKADLEAENERLRKKLKEIETAPLGAEQAVPTAPITPAGVVSGGSGGAGAGAGRGSAASYDPLRTDRQPTVSGSLEEKIAAAEREIGAPPGLLRAQMKQESNFNPNAVSKAGAMGLAQVMPETLRSLERRFGRKLDPYNEDDAILIQKELMRENYGAFGNWDDALRAYNGGWNRSRWGNPETAGYVPAIKGHMSRQQGMKMPDEAKPAGGGQSGQYPAGFSVSAQPMDLRISFDGQGRPIAPPQQSVGLKVNVSRPSPFGLQGPVYQ